MTKKICDTPSTVGGSYISAAFEASLLTTELLLCSMALYALEMAT